MGADSRADVASYLRRRRDLYGDSLILGDSAPGEEPAATAEQTNKSFDGTLEQYHREIENCQKCALGQSRTNFVFGVGDPNADLVFVGEAPGAEEDKLGEPFVGRSGKQLDKILAAINLSRESVYILNVLKCRPPENRNPTAAEVVECEPYLQEQLRLLNPKLIVALGRVAAQTLLKTEETTLKEMRSKIYEYSGIEVRVTYHPAALLRNPNFKAQAWEDFQAIRDRYLELTASGPSA